MHPCDIMFVLKTAGVEVRESDRYEAVYSIIAFCLLKSIVTQVYCQSNIKFTNEFLMKK
jgi:hypothetical protein